jgi:holin-like protein
MRALLVFCHGALRGTVPLLFQLATFVLIDQLARHLTLLLRLPFPPSLVGMIVLATFLMSGVFRESWLAQSADLLQRHLAFFFVPIAVGLMAYGPLIRAHGAGLLLIISISSAFGLAVAGWIGSPASPSRPQLPSP